jgi:HEAT repeat protein
MTHIENPDVRSLADALADPQRREAALARLVARGAEARADVLAAIGDGRWEVRRACAAYLWRCPCTDLAAALEPLLRDPKSKVRQAAVVALAVGTEPGSSPDALTLLLERALHDDSLRVRRQTVSLLAWRHAHPDLEGFFEGLAADESDAKIQRWARAGARFCRGGAALARERAELAAEVDPC